ncbi:MAG: hypothetical protein V1838_02930 [Patescibacteria group bacterium]
MEILKGLFILWGGLSGLALGVGIVWALILLIKIMLQVPVAGTILLAGIISGLSWLLIFGLFTLHCRRLKKA